LAGDFAQIGELIWINKSRSGKGAPIVVPVPPLIYWGSCTTGYSIWIYVQTWQHVGLFLHEGIF
jgi:hypothetical protein